MKLVTAAQMREMDRKTIEEYGLPGVVLMENAGRAVADAAWDMLPDDGGRVLILAGKGNNGGDGFVAARHLSGRGVEVAVLLLCKASELQGDAAVNCNYAQKIGLTVAEEPDDETLVGAIELADVIVDAILGTGLSGDVHGRPREVIEMLEYAVAPIVAVDTPSGLDSDTGDILGAAVEAHVTVTFALAKTGLVQYPGKAHVGELRVVDIGIPPAILDDPVIETYYTEASDCQAMLPYRAPDANKGDAGRVLVIAGSSGLTGAATMAGYAAARAGAGLVTVGVPAPLQAIVAGKLTEVMTVGLPSGESDTISLEALEMLMEWAERVDVVALGPGLSLRGEVSQLVEALTEQIEKPLIIDADGLNALAHSMDVLRSRRHPTVITPHPGELSRLVDRSIPEIQADRLAVACQTAEDLGCVVVLKGAGTVTAEPNGEAWINPGANPGMASGGMGDVLTGIIAALIAGGSDVMSGAVAGVYLQGLAADIAAEQLGPRGFLALEVADRLPLAYKRLWES